VEISQVFIKEEREDETKDMISSFHADVSGDERDPSFRVTLNHISLTILKIFSTFILWVSYFLLNFFYFIQTKVEISQVFIKEEAEEDPVCSTILEVSNTEEEPHAR